MRLLDLFAGAGGAGMGYHRAGFEVVGVDHKPQPRYPFTFHRADALEYLAAHGHEFDVIHASPPCQAYTALRSVCKGRSYPELVAPTRAALMESGKPYVIENVPGSPLVHTITLCGAMFGLKTYRHRRFECSIHLWRPPHPKHRVPAGGNIDRQRKARFLAGECFATVTGNIGSYCGTEAMGIDWMTGRELSQAIPPAYTEWIGRQIWRHLR